LFDDLSSRELQGKLRGMMARCLTEREQEVISLRYGMTGAAPLTQREVAERLGISRSYVSRIETRALERLRQEFGDT
jgi:RNA polymerase sporulation-specific sigma factor